MEPIASPFDFVIFYKKKIVSQNSRAFSSFFFLRYWLVSDKLTIDLQVATCQLCM